MKISQIIKEKRKHLGLTQENIAEYLGVSIPAVSKWENGTTYPDITITMPTAMLSAQIGMKECRQAVAFLIKYS